MVYEVKMWGSLTGMSEGKDGSNNKFKLNDTKKAWKLSVLFVMGETAIYMFKIYTLKYYF